MNVKVNPKKKSIFDWFLTPAGKNFSASVIGLAGISAIVVKFLPNVILIDKYQEIICAYKDGLPIPVSKEVETRFEKAKELLEIPKHENKFIKPFTVFGFDMFNAGLSYSRFGAIIGIPKNFTYESTETADRRGIMVNNQPINWSQEEAHKLLKSLVLSEKAQIFAIAREIEEVRSIKFVLDTSYPVMVLLGLYTAAQSHNRRFNLYSKPLPVRVIFYSLLSLFGYGVYSFLKDFTQTQFDLKIDKRLAEKNPIFVEGGKEYYEKVIERNKALRALLGKQGEKMYSVYGNENFFLRQKRLPLTVHKMYFESKLQGESS